MNALYFPALAKQQEVYFDAQLGIMSQLQIVKYIDKNLNILTMYQNEFYLPSYWLEQWSYHSNNLLFISDIIACTL